MTTKLSRYAEQQLRGRLSAQADIDKARCSYFLWCLGALYLASDEDADSVVDARILEAFGLQARAEGLDHDEVINAICMVKP